MASMNVRTHDGAATVTDTSGSADQAAEPDAPCIEQPRLGAKGCTPRPLSVRCRLSGLKAHAGTATACRPARKVDEPVLSAVAPSTLPGADVAVVVAPPCLGHALGQSLEGLAPPQALTRGGHPAPLACQCMPAQPSTLLGASESRLPPCDLLSMQQSLIAEGLQHAGVLDVTGL